MGHLVAMTVRDRLETLLVNVDNSDGKNGAKLTLLVQKKFTN